MDLQSLPRYRGLPDSPRGWDEPDEHGKMPSMRLRDYVVLSLLIIMCFPTGLSFLLHQWASQRSLMAANSSRDELVWNRLLEP